MSSAMGAQRDIQPPSASTATRLLAALEARLPVVLALVAMALILWPINGASRDYDEGVYWQSLRAMASGHPLYTSVFSSQPPAFLLSIYPFYVALGQTIAAARFGIAVFGVIGILAMYWLGHTLGGRWVGLAAAALLAIDPLYLHEARTLQAEGPGVALEIVCVALAVAASQRAGRARTLLALASGLALALGTLTKLLDVVAVVPIALYLAAPVVALWLDAAGRVRRPSNDALRSAVRATLPALGWVALGGLIGCVLILAPFAARFGAIWDQAVRFHLVAAQVEPTSLGHHLAIVLGGMPTLSVPALVGLALAIWRRAWRMLPPLLWLLASALLLVRQTPLFNHHIVLVIPCLALMGALSLTLLPAPAGDTRWLAWGAPAVLGVCFLIGLGLGAHTALQSAQAPNADTRLMTQAIDAFTTPGQPLVTDDQYVAALADRDTPPELVDTSGVRIDTGYLTAAQLETILSRPDTRFVALATGRLRRTPNFLPWLNANYRLLADLGNGRAIYERAPTSSPIV